MRRMTPTSSDSRRAPPSWEIRRSRIGYERQDAARQRQDAGRDAPRSNSEAGRGAGCPAELRSQAMTSARAERTVVVTMRLLALTFAVVGLLFIITPDGVIGRVDDVGDALGSFSS